MSTVPPASTSNGLLHRSRYFYAQLGADPHQAVQRCAGYWVSTGARDGTPGMREQLAQTLQMHGVLVEEPRFFFGSDLPSDHLFTMDDVLSTRRAAK